jgi:hypothetical protein
MTPATKPCSAVGWARLCAQQDAVGLTIRSLPNLQTERPLVKKKEFSRSQNIVFNIASFAGLLGIYVFMNTQTDMTDIFAIAIFFIACIPILWALRRFVRDNVK